MKKFLLILYFFGCGVAYISAQNLSGSYIDNRHNSTAHLYLYQPKNATMLLGIVERIKGSDTSTIALIGQIRGDSLQLIEKKVIESNSGLDKCNYCFQRFYLYKKTADNTVYFDGFTEFVDKDCNAQKAQPFCFRKTKTYRTAADVPRSLLLWFKASYKNAK